MTEIGKRALAELLPRC